MDSDDHGTNKIENASSSSLSNVDSSSDSDSEQTPKVEWLATGRQRRATAGNRMKSMLANEEEPDSDLELLFAEQGDDQGFSDVDEAASDVHMDSSSDDEGDTNNKPNVDEDLEGEQELERQAKERRAAQRKRKAQEAIPAKFRKKVRVTPSANPRSPAVNPEPRPKKKSERASWLPLSTDMPTRASSRKTTLLSKEQLLQQMEEREAKRIKQLAQMQKKAAKLEAMKKPPLTQEDRLREAAIVEERNSKSLNRWEEAEKIREEERLAKLAALNNRTLQGPVITFWSGVGRVGDGWLKNEGYHFMIEEKPKRKPKAIKDKEKATTTTAATATAAKSSKTDADTDVVMADIPAHDTTGLQEPGATKPDVKATSAATEDTQLDTKDASVAEEIITIPVVDSESTIATGESKETTTNNDTNKAIESNQAHVSGAAPEQQGNEQPASASAIETKPLQESTPSPSNEPTSAPPPELTEGIAEIPVVKADEDGVPILDNEQISDDASKAQDLAITVSAKKIEGEATAKPVEAVTQQNTSKESEPNPESVSIQPDTISVSTTPKPADIQAVNTTVGNADSNHPSVAATPQPQPQPENETDSTLPGEATTRNAMMFQNFHDAAIRDKNTQTILLFGRKMSKLPKPPPTAMCGITNTPARYRDPQTHLPFATAAAYCELKRLEAGEHRWSKLLGCWVGSGTYAARGVPERFLRTHRCPTLEEVERIQRKKDEKLEKEKADAAKPKEQDKKSAGQIEDGTLSAGPNLAEPKLADPTLLPVQPIAPQ